MENQQSKKSFFSSSLAERAAYREGDRILTPSQYNRTIGFSLLYGFGVNALITFLAREPLYRLATENTDSFTTILIVFLIAYLGLSLGGSVIMNSSRTFKGAFLGYSMIVLPMGLLLSFALMDYSSDIIFEAMTITTVITGVMMLVSMWKPDLFLRIGPALGIALLATIAVELLASLLVSFLHLSWFSSVIDYVVIAVFALYVGFDWARANALPTTSRNAVVISASLFLDIINIFLRVLSILSRAKSRD